MGRYSFHVGLFHPLLHAGFNRRSLRVLILPLHKRKNWLFVGSVEAGYRAADFLTLVSSAVRNNLDVWVYVKDVLDRLLAGETDYAALRPDAWAATHPEFIREYRIAENRNRADHRKAHRARRRTAQR